MEKNRFSNQSSSKGQLTESKKNQETSAKWPRHSKRREQPSSSGSNKPENYRNTSSKAASAGKGRNQTNYNYDKRSRQRPEATSSGLLPDAAPSAFESFDQFEEQFDGAGLVPVEGGSGVAPAVRHELHSVFAPGSKKQSLNHLLNFHYTPRERDQPMRLSKTGNIRCHAMKKISYNKEQFLQANCQFVVRSGEDYSAFLASPDQLVEWSKIEQIHILSAEEPQCPICLYPPVAAKMTKCGHVYCWPCILHYLALSDKTWRKCPICYEAIHLPDLRSAVSKPFHSYGVGEYVTFQLMRREKNSVHVTVASESDVENRGIPHFDSKSGNNILSKLLVANIEETLGIINREQQELLNQIVLDGVDCPENIFVQQALDQLEDRKRDVLSKKAGKAVEPQPTTSFDDNACVEQAQADEVTTTAAVVEVGETNSDRASSTQDFLIDEDSNFSLSDIDIVPTQQCASSNYFYFYQSTDGQPLYLHSLNTRMLQAMYGGLDKSPQKINGKIVHKDSCSLSEDLRKRLRYLQHLPVCTQFDVIEVEFEADVISRDVFALFKDEINKRKKDRQKRARAERIRERQIFEFNERQLGKSMARSAKIPIDSTKHFPSCGNSDTFDFSREPALGTSLTTTDSLASPSTASSWSKMLSTSPAASRWPSLPSGGSVNAFGALATPTPRTVQVTGSNVSVTSRASQRRATSESDYEENDDDLEGARAPEFCNTLSFAIEAALEKATLNHGEPVTSELSTKIKSKAGVGAVAGASAKKKKTKKTLLFASGMNLN